jgi:hypothetical protein
MLPSALSRAICVARCTFGVLGSAGAGICLAPCGSALGEWNLGQAINAVTGTRLWPNSHWAYQSGVDGGATECGQANFSLRASKTSSHTGIRRGGGGSIELEQMVSANPPLAVHRLHGGRHHQRRYCGTGEVQQQAGPIGSGHTCLAPDHRPVFVRAAVRQQAAGIGRPRMKGNVEWDLRSAV